MLNVLLESHAPRPRRFGSTVASTMLHAALVAGAVALTMPRPVDANGVKPVQSPVVYLRAPHDRTPAASPRGGTPNVARPDFVPRTIVPVTDVPVELPYVDAGPVIPRDEIVIGNNGVSTASPIGSGGPLQSGTGVAIDERLVDRAPRLLGAVREPSYPPSLREAGVQGRVLVQFVVDTLGRAELEAMQVMESPHPLFVESVRAALARYRFSVGESGGRKVRTRVQIPFEFMLAR